MTFYTRELSAEEAAALYKRKGVPEFTPKNEEVYTKELKRASHSDPEVNSDEQNLGSMEIGDRWTWVFQPNALSADGTDEFSVSLLMQAKDSQGQQEENIDLNARSNLCATASLNNQAIDGVEKTEGGELTNGGIATITGNLQSGLALKTSSIYTMEISRIGEKKFRFVEKNQSSGRVITTVTMELNDRYSVSGDIKTRAAALVGDYNVTFYKGVYYGEQGTENEKAWYGYWGDSPFSYGFEYVDGECYWDANIKIPEKKSGENKEEYEKRLGEYFSNAIRLLATGKKTEDFEDPVFDWMLDTGILPIDYKINYITINGTADVAKEYGGQALEEGTQFTVSKEALDALKDSGRKYKGYVDFGLGLNSDAGTLLTFYDKDCSECVIPESGLTFGTGKLTEEEQQKAEKILKDTGFTGKYLMYQTPETALANKTGNVYVGESHYGHSIYLGELKDELEFDENAVAKNLYGYYYFEDLEGFMPIGLAGVHYSAGDWQNVPGMKILCTTEPLPLSCVITDEYNISQKGLPELSEGAERLAGYGWWTSKDVSSSHRILNDGTYTFKLTNLRELRNRVWPDILVPSAFCLEVFGDIIDNPASENSKVIDTGYITTTSLNDGWYYSSDGKLFGDKGIDMDDKAPEPNYDLQVDISHEYSCSLKVSTNDDKTKNFEFIYHDDTVNKDIVKQTYRNTRMAGMANVHFLMQVGQADVSFSMTDTKGNPIENNDANIAIAADNSSVVLDYISSNQADGKKESVVGSGWWTNYQATKSISLKGNGTWDYTVDMKDDGKEEDYAAYSVELFAPVENGIAYIDSTSDGDAWLGGTAAGSSPSDAGQIYGGAYAKKGHSYHVTITRQNREITIRYEDTQTKENFSHKFTMDEDCLPEEIFVQMLMQYGAADITFTDSSVNTLEKEAKSDNGVITVGVGEDEKAVVKGDVFADAAQEESKVVVDYEGEEGQAEYVFDNIEQNLNFTPVLEVGNSDDKINKIMEPLTMAEGNKPATDYTTVSFTHEGFLPGKAKVSVKVDKASKKLLNQSRLFLYYFNPVTQTFEIDGEAEVDKDKETATFEMEHCSDYILTDRMITDTKVVSSKAKTVGKRTTESDSGGAQKEEGQEDSDGKQKEESGGNSDDKQTEGNQEDSGTKQTEETKDNSGDKKQDENGGNSGSQSGQGTDNPVNSTNTTGENNLQTSNPSSDTKSDKTTSGQKKSSKKIMKLSSVSVKKGKKKITGKVSVKKAAVKIKVGSKKFKKAKVSGKKFTLKLSAKLKKGTKITIKVTKSGYTTLKKTYKVK